MKGKLILSMLLVLIGLSSIAQQTNIVTAIAKQDSDCGSTDIGYQIYYGEASSSELDKKATAEVKKDRPGYDYVESKDNTSWGDYLGDYIVIISTSTTNSDGCRRFTYGVGYGDNSSEALEDALSHLNGRNWSWSKSRDGYDIVLQKRY